MLRSHAPHLLTLAALLAALPALADFAVSPVLIQKGVTAEDRTVEFTLSNAGDKPLQITLSTAPLTHDRDGAPVEGPAGYAFDASGLIRLEQKRFVLPPRRWKRVRAQVDLPARAGGGYAFIYASAQPLDAAAEGSIATALRVGVVVQLTFPKRGREAVEIQQARADGQTLRIAVRNTGQVHLRPGGRVTLVDAEGRQRWSGSLNSANIFPGMVRELAAEGVPAGLPPGAYTLAVEVDAPEALRSAGRTTVGLILP